MSKTRRALTALAVALAAACFTAEAQAADSISFGDQGQTATFGANAIVRIDGTITYESHCPKPGINDFFYPATDVYIVPSGAGTGTLHDACGGRPNTIVSSATVFTDELIALTAPGGQPRRRRVRRRLRHVPGRAVRPGLRHDRCRTPARGRALKAARDVKEARRRAAAVRVHRAR
jgi:hypothetical protein